MRKRCNTCGGEYDELTTDGMLYFHVCPPITRVRVIRDGQDQRVDLAELRATDRVRVRRDGATVEINADQMQPGDERIGDVTRPRADHRDENSATLGGEEEPDDRMPRRRRRLRARGRGVTDIPDRRDDAL